MKDVDKKNIIFLSDENTPYVKEFTLLSDEEIADYLKVDLDKIDFKAIAKKVNIDEDMVKKIVAALKK